MKYAIVSVTNGRERHKANIRERLSNHEEVTDIRWTGPSHDVLAEAENWGLTLTNWRPKIGELGVWLSQFAAWNWVVEHDEPLIVLEDDCRIGPEFDFWYDHTFDWPDAEILALWVPPEQHGDWHYDHPGSGIQWPNAAPDKFVGSERTARAYQGFGCVALQFWPDGARKLIEAAKALGVYTPVDCFIFECGWPDEIRRCPDRIDIGAPTPAFAKCVSVDREIATTVQDTAVL